MGADRWQFTGRAEFEGVEYYRWMQLITKYVPAYGVGTLKLTTEKNFHYLPVNTFWPVATENVPWSDKENTL